MNDTARVLTVAPGRILEREIAATAALKEQLKSILGDDGADADILTNTAEGETNLFETIDAVLGQIGMDNAAIESIEKFAGNLSARKSRLEKRVEYLRTMLANALEIIEQKKVERPLATLTLKIVPPKLVITNEADIPAAYWKPSDPTLDRRGLTEALKARQSAIAASKDGKTTIRNDELSAVLGVELGNGSVTVQIRFS